MEYILEERMQALSALKKHYPQSSRRTLQQWLKGGRFTLDNRPLQKDNETLEPGQVLRSEEAFRPKSDGVLNILYEDKSLIFIDKPASLLSVPLDVPSDERNVLSLLRERANSDQIFAVHRLDRQSSGVLVFAKGVDAMDRLKELFETHDLHREYFAIVEGRIPEDQGSWKCNLKELPSFDVVPANPPEGKEAITHFQVLRRSAKYSYLSCLLETGRKHQIRVHCQRAGYPILGDRRYGSSENPIRRLALHARKLAFIHPFTGNLLSFTSSLPASFKKLGATDESLN